MSGARVALFIGCSDYDDSRFQHLPAPDQDIAALTRVLVNPAIGDFTVETLRNESSATVTVKIEEFFADRKPDDLLLLYFSCHGVLDARGRLYFVAADTRRDLLGSTGISAQWIKQQMDHGRSQRIVLLLDCCYSGAFSRGLPPASGDTAEIDYDGPSGSLEFTDPGEPRSAIYWISEFQADGTVKLLQGVRVT